MKRTIKQWCPAISAIWTKSLLTSTPRRPRHMTLKIKVMAVNMHNKCGGVKLV